MIPLPSVTPWPPYSVTVQEEEIHMTCAAANRVLAAGVMLAFFAAGAVVARAQAKKPIRLNQDGTLVAVAANQITVSSEGKVYQIKIKADQNVVAVTGKLAPEQLQSGMIVRFTGMLKGSTIDGEVAEVKVYTSADGYQAGILQDSPDLPATITGTLQTFKNGTLSVGAGRKKITAKLADGAAVLIDTKDYRVASRGDAVHFEGTLADDKTTVSARKVVITVGGSAGGEKDPQGAGGKAKKKRK
jgi:hypothetical protein